MILHAKGKKLDIDIFQNEIEIANVMIYTNLFKSLHIFFTLSFENMLPKT